MQIIFKRRKKRLMFEFIQKSNKFAKCDEKILNEINKNTNQERLTELSTKRDT